MGLSRISVKTNISRFLRISRLLRRLPYQFSIYFCIIQHCITEFSKLSRILICEILKNFRYFKEFPYFIFPKNVAKHNFSFSYSQWYQIILALPDHLNGRNIPDNPVFSDKAFLDKLIFLLSSKFQQSQYF